MYGLHDVEHWADLWQQPTLPTEEVAGYLEEYRDGNLVLVVLFYRAESDVAAFLAHPLAIVGSAVRVTAPGRAHPRSFGAHARVL